MIRTVLPLGDAEGAVQRQSRVENQRRVFEPGFDRRVVERAQIGDDRHDREIIGARLAAKCFEVRLQARDDRLHARIGGRAEKQKRGSQPTELFEIHFALRMQANAHPRQRIADGDGIIGQNEARGVLCGQGLGADMGGRIAPRI